MRRGYLCSAAQVQAGDFVGLDAFPAGAGRPCEEPPLAPWMLREPRMLTNATCPRCAAPLPMSHTGPAGETRTCPQCGFLDPVIAAPLSPAPDEVPWWATPQT